MARQRRNERIASQNLVFHVCQQRLAGFCYYKHTNWYGVAEFSVFTGGMIYNVGRGTDIRETLLSPYLQRLSTGMIQVTSNLDEHGGRWRVASGSRAVFRDQKASYKSPLFH